MNNNISELVIRFRNDQKFLINYYQELFNKINSAKKFNFYVQLYPDEVLNKIADPHFFAKFKNRSLFGVPFFAKDNFMIENKKVTCGTKILSNFISPFSATVCQLLEAEGAILLGKTTADELAMAGTGLEAVEGFVENPFDAKRIVGGSSSGSVVAVSQSLCAFALGSDTGDSIRLPASYLGVFGFKPTFGLISRYGLISYSPSLDTIGFFANDVTNLQLVSKILFTHDPKDLTCQKNKLSSAVSLTSLAKIKVLVIGLNKGWVNPDFAKTFKNTFLENLVTKKVHVEIHKLPIEIIENLTFLYQIISYSEALSSQANLTGVNFGFNQSNRQKDNFFDLIKNNRTKAFGWELKRRYLLASLFTSSEYQKDTYFQAKKMRTYINNYFANLFKKFDFIIHLASPDLAPKISDVQDYKKKRVPQLNVAMLLLIANFGGFPSLVVPFTKKKGLGVGINIFANFNQDFRLLDFAKLLEEQIINEK